MYSVYNKALDEWILSNGTTRKIKDLEENELIEIAIKYNFGIPDGTKLDFESGEPIPVSKALMDSIKVGCNINWVGVTRNDLNFKNREQKKFALSTIDSDKFYEAYQEENLGLFNLKPGESQEVRADVKFIEDLIKTGHADKIRITDTETNQVIFDGGLTEREYTTLELNHKNEKEKKTYKYQAICNVLHPAKERAIYIPEVKASIPALQIGLKYSSIEEAKQAYFEKFNKQPHHLKGQATIESELLD